MPSLLAKGVTLTESIVLWPFRAAQELAKGNPGLKEVFHIAEDLVDIPFERARNILDKREVIRKAGDTGPALSNIFVSPEVTIISDCPFGEERRAIIRVTGLLCEA